MWSGLLAGGVGVTGSSPGAAGGEEAMKRWAVLFDLGGVVFGPGLQHFLGFCERDFALPRYGLTRPGLARRRFSARASASRRSARDT